MDIEQLLQEAVKAGASDLHLSSGVAPMLRVDGELKPLSNYPVSHKELEPVLRRCMDDYARKNFNDQWDADFAFEVKSLGRFRANVFLKAEGIAADFRVIPLSVPMLDTLHLPEVLKKLTQLPHGLILVAGPAGSGKSTTLAAMVENINTEVAKHILTIEDPIEFLFQSKKSLIEQRELGKSTKSFAHALRAALREDPDIIMVGEMRDLDTIRLSLTAAETGHLVLATLHTPSAEESIYRIIDVFPSEEKSLVRSMLAESLQAVIAQTLIQKKEGGRIALMEIMLANHAVRNLIREDKIAQLASVIQTGASEGMQTFEQHRAQLKEFINAL